MSAPTWYQASASGSIITDASVSRTIFAMSAGRCAAVHASINSRWYEAPLLIFLAAARASPTLPSAKCTYGVTHAAHSDPASKCTKSIARSVLPISRNDHAHDRYAKFPGSAARAVLHSCVD